MRFDFLVPRPNEYYDYVSNSPSITIPVRDTAATDVSWVYGVCMHISTTYDYVTERIIEVLTNRKRIKLLRKDQLISKNHVHKYNVKSTISRFNKFNKEANKR